jgi:hypothetical protein
LNNAIIAVGLCHSRYVIRDSVRKFVEFIDILVLAGMEIGMVDG